MKAIELMAQEVRKMKVAAGDDPKAECNMIDIANIFLDQCDRAKTIPPVTPVATPKAVAPVYGAPDLKVAMMHCRPQYHRELQAMHIPTIDPYKDRGVGCIVGDGCNSCC